MAGTPVNTRPFECVCPAGQWGRTRVGGRGQGHGRAQGGRGKATARCHVGGRGQMPGDRARERGGNQDRAGVWDSPGGAGPGVWWSGLGLA